MFQTKSQSPAGGRVPLQRRGAAAVPSPAGRAVKPRRRAAGQSGLRNPERLFALLAETFQALGDPTRVQIVWTLSQGELCVGDLARKVGMSQPAVSHHLRTLRNLKLVRVRRDGRTSYYAIDDDHIGRLLSEGIEHVEDLIG
ncbi:MAG: metalloregulator ArsR/SmtB family transcription factor [Oligoflexia bacterium]|nr:metalloregulator ArsR/SmtB family transcription factor [Oligoflexia bacterium]